MSMHRWAVLLLAAAGAAEWTSAAEYYVAPQSAQAADNNDGTPAAPLKTLARACELAGPGGDTVRLGAGTYREVLRPARSGAAGHPIRFVAATGERVILSGTEPLAGDWQPHRGNIYRLDTRLKFTQLFVAGRMMLEARWPNSPFSDLMVMNRARAGEGTGYELLADPNLPAGDWEGAVVLLWPGSEWVNTTRRVTEYQPGKSFRFDVTTEHQRKDPYHAADPYQPRAGNPYVLVGSLAGLDSPGEWFLDEGTGTVYLWAPDGRSPAADTVEVKQRDYAVDLRGLSHIEISGLDLFGAGVNMSDAQSCLLEDCRLRYPEHVREYAGDQVPPARNVMTGRGNEWRRCLIAYAATTGLAVGGEDNALVNCVVHDVNYLGSGRGGVDLRRSVRARVQRCTLFRAGRDTVQHSGSKGIRLEYNDVSGANMLNNDAGAIYCWGADSQSGLIAYNWVHDSPNANGIYLDNFSSGFTVHHNVVWACGGDGFHINSDALDHLIVNNTVTQVRRAFGTYCYPAYTPTMKGMRVINNLLNAEVRPDDPTVFVQGGLGPEYHHNGPGAVDEQGYPLPGSAAIDAGVVVEGITDGYQGRAPDLGAYESGGPRWVAGADWSDPEAPPPPMRDLSYQPRGPVTEEEMITQGLVLWLDAADGSTVQATAAGVVERWRDKSPRGLSAVPPAADRSVQWVERGWEGKGVMRGNGTGCLRVEGLERGPGPLTMLLVSAGPKPDGPAWQRLISCFTGEGQEWVFPNWMIGRQGGATPAAYPARIFSIIEARRAALATITVLGATAVEGQYLAGDVAEVLVFDRLLRFDEAEALEQYLRAKWGIEQ